VRPIQLGVTDGDRVEVRSGLSPGDRIVIDGADKLRDGAKINIRAETPANTPSPTPSPGQGPDKSGGRKRHTDNGQKQ
jgi:multidrug efflux system membrane fusion protein